MKIRKKMQISKFAEQRVREVSVVHDPDGRDQGGLPHLQGRLPRGQEGDGPVLEDRVRRAEGQGAVHVQGQEDGAGEPGV